MKKLLLFGALLMATASFSQAKKELEAELTELSESVAKLETKNQELISQVDDIQSKYESVLSDRIAQEIEKADLQHDVDSLTSAPNGSSQAQFSNVQLREFSNQTASFTVPAGETWEIVNIWADYIINVNLEKDETDAVYIFIRSINGKILTDVSKNKFGGCVYRGPSNHLGMKMPLILPEKTEISFVITSKPYNSSVSELNNDLSAFINYVVH